MRYGEKWKHALSLSLLPSLPPSFIPSLLPSSSLAIMRGCSKKGTWQSRKNGLPDSSSANTLIWDFENELFSPQSYKEYISVICGVQMKVLCFSFRRNMLGSDNERPLLRLVPRVCLKRWQLSRDQSTGAGKEGPTHEELQEGIAMIYTHQILNIYVK